MAIVFHGVAFKSSHPYRVIVACGFDKSLGHMSLKLYELPPNSFYSSSCSTDFDMAL
eukprot:COSAG02_NODE_1589_length_11792_cov_203.500898_7_plen_57_part_00